MSKTLHFNKTNYLKKKHWISKQNIEETGKNNHYEVNMSNIVGQTRSGRKSEEEIQRRLGGFIF